MIKTTKDSDLTEALERMLDMWLPWRMKYDQVPGIAISVSYKSKTIYHSNFGFADIDRKIKLNDDSLFRGASISKMFTAVAILQLVDLEKLTLESKVSKYLKEFDNKDLRAITVRNLLSHQGGVFRDSNKNYWVENSFTDNVLADITDKTKVINPLKHFKYSNFGYSILGKLIEKASGQKYDAYVNSNIIKKLNLKNTYTDYHSTLESQLATGYSRFIPNENRTSFKHFKALEFAPATGIVTTSKDMVIFLNDLISKNSKILPEYLISEMTHPYSKTGNGDGSHYGLGFNLEYINKKKIVGHGGGCNGFITSAQVMPHEELTVVVFTNCIGGPAWTISNAIFSFFDKIKYMSGHLNKVDTGKYEGVYRDRWGETCVVGVKNTLIPFSVEGPRPFENNNYLAPKSNDSFVNHSSFNFGAPDEVVIFEEVKKGKSQIMNWAGGKNKRV